jgi:hypothetical protein
MDLMGIIDKLLDKLTGNDKQFEEMSQRVQTLERASALLAEVSDPEDKKWQTVQFEKEWFSADFENGELQQETIIQSGITNGNNIIIVQDADGNHNLYDATYNALITTQPQLAKPFINLGIALAFAEAVAELMDREYPGWQFVGEYAQPKVHTLYQTMQIDEIQDTFRERRG